MENKLSYKGNSVLQDDSCLGGPVTMFVLHDIHLQALLFGPGIHTSFQRTNPKTESNLGFSIFGAGNWEMEQQSRAVLGGFGEPVSAVYAEEPRAEQENNFICTSDSQPGAIWLYREYLAKSTDVFRLS